jgi:galactokinase
MMSNQELKEQFVKIYGSPKEDEISLFFAPGRVNLIGEHTDYNGGYVLPCSLQYGTYLLVRRISDPMVKFRSLNFPMNAQVCMKREIAKIGNTWINYPLGVFKEFVARGHKIPGLELLFAGNIPQGAGLSSSASIEMVTAFAINELLAIGLPITELINLSQHAENEFVGMKCGIMDQFAVGLGKKDHALSLNCKTLEYDLIPLVLNNHSLVITNTNKTRALTESGYNERRKECDAAVQVLNRKARITYLADLTPDDFSTLENMITDPVIKKRAKHIITENHRAKMAAEKLVKNDLDSFGKLMVESHRSLSDDYEVSCAELDTLVELSLAIAGVAGSRMTGAGFGGCTVSIVANGSLDTFRETVGKKYFEKTGLSADFYIASTEDGVKALEF